jgi:hypothetical protein
MRGPLGGVARRNAAVPRRGPVPATPPTRHFVSRLPHFIETAFRASAPGGFLGVTTSAPASAKPDEPPIRTLRRHGATPSENFGVLRLRRPVFNPFSTAGLMVTSYSGGNRTNLGLGGDGTFRVTGDHYLTLKYSATVDSDDPSTVTLGSRSLFDFKWERRVSRGLQFNINSTHMGRAYRPEVGFLQRSDYTTANIAGNYFIYTDKHNGCAGIIPARCRS